MYVSVFWLMPRPRIASKAHVVTYRDAAAGAIIVGDRTLCGIAIPFSAGPTYGPVDELCCSRCEKILAKKEGE